MDSLSQIALGSAVAIGVMGRRTAVWKAATWGAIAGTLPDLDVVIDHGDALLNMVLHHAPDPPAVLAEIRRVLRPGGSLLIADLARHERETAREQLADQWLGFDEAELTGWLKAAGFGEILCERTEGTTGQETVLVVKTS